MAQKVIEGGLYTWRHMHVTLRWLKIRTVQFLFNFSSKYPSRVKTLRWLTFFSSKTPRWLKIRREIGFEPKMIRILSHLRVFELKKVSHLKVLTRDGYFELKLKKNWTVRILSHLKVTCKCLHVSTPPSKTFWAISRTPAYYNVKFIKAFL